MIEIFNWDFDENDVLFCTGVVPAISSIVRKLLKDNENVVMLTPIYNIFLTQYTTIIK
ncbi:hypothetical protein [Spiroplasma tabanidicola]|uniref:hypothetical protein n=1 Tax=Spiroplasma tabanidicola TaxID=324079 RepID=UPI001B886C37|nr:hypothetical protein [Spiroplasma tabanidicola]